MSWFKRLFAKRKAPGPLEIASWLLDKSIEFGDRDEAAMALGELDCPEAEEALLKVAFDHSEDDMIVDTAGDSLLQIWMRQERKPESAQIERMHPMARRYFEADD